jgi:hypothetical protein
MKAVMSLYGAITATSLRISCADGREKRAKRIPVIRAKPIRPESASMATRELAAVPCGVI